MVGSIWYLDTGASFHMINDNNILSTLEEKDLQMRIKMGDDGKYHVSSEGMVMFQREHGAPLTLTDVKYVPGLKKNRVYVSMLEDKGYHVVFSKGKVFLRHIGTGQTKRIGVRVKNLYKLEVDDYAKLSSKVELVQSQDVGELWHRRSCGLEDHAAYFYCTSKEKTGADGYMQKLYLRCWIYFMQNKDQTFSGFCEFKALAEKEFGRKIRALHSKNGGEYVSPQFKDFYATEGNKRELTTPHNPQQNGVAERKNRSFVGVARAMSHDQSLPFNLWVEAYNTTIYL
eukprot:PITA_23284